MRQPGCKANLALKNVLCNCKHIHSSSLIRLFKKVVFFFTAFTDPLGTPVFKASG